MGRIAPRKNTSLGFSLPGLDGLREKWRRRFGHDDDVSQAAGEDDKRALQQIPDGQDGSATTSSQDASYALAIGSAVDEDEPQPTPIGRAGATTGDEPFTTPLGSTGHRPDYLAEVPPRTESPPRPALLGRGTAREDAVGDIVASAGRFYNGWARRCHLRQRSATTRRLCPHAGRAGGQQRRRRQHG